MIEQQLDQLAEYQAQRTLLDMDKQKLIDAVLTAEINAQLQEIEAEFSQKVEGVDANIATLTEQVKAEVLKAGASVKGSYLHAVWAKGREGGWDGAKLKGFAMAHPEIMAAKKPDGEPTVSIRKI